MPGRQTLLQKPPAQLSIPPFNRSAMHRRISRGTLLNPLISRDGTRVKKHLSPPEPPGQRASVLGECNKSRN